MQAQARTHHRPEKGWDVFGRKTMIDMVEQSAENVSERRKFLRAAGLAGLGAVGAAAVLRTSGETAEAADPAVRRGDRR
jgi:hypothetical protein